MRNFETGHVLRVPLHDRLAAELRALGAAPHFFRLDPSPNSGTRATKEPLAIGRHGDTHGRPQILLELLGLEVGGVGPGISILFLLAFLRPLRFTLEPVVFTSSFRFALLPHGDILAAVARHYEIALSPTDGDRRDHPFFGYRRTLRGTR